VVIADRGAGLGEGLGDLVDLDRVLREDRSAALLTFGGGGPGEVELAALGLGEFEGGLGHRGVLTDEQALEDGLRDGVGVHWDRYSDAELGVDRPVLAQEDLEDDAVDGVVLAVEGDRADGGARLAVAVHPALALLVTRGVPAQVVVEDGVEGIL
jgi:hypothetical protein